MCKAMAKVKKDRKLYPGPAARSSSRGARAACAACVVVWGWGVWVVERRGAICTLEKAGIKSHTGTMPRQHMSTAPGLQYQGTPRSKASVQASCFAKLERREHRGRPRPIADSPVFFPHTPTTHTHSVAPLCIGLVFGGSAAHGPWAWTGWFYLPLSGASS